MQQKSNKMIGNQTFCINVLFSSMDASGGSENQYYEKETGTAQEEALYLFLFYF